MTTSPPKSVSVHGPVQREELAVLVEPRITGSSLRHQLVVLPLVEDLLANRELIVAVAVKGSLELIEAILTASYPTTQVECLEALFTAPKGRLVEQ